MFSWYFSTRVAGVSEQGMNSALMIQHRAFYRIAPLTELIKLRVVPNYGHHNQVTATSPSYRSKNSPYLTSSHLSSILCVKSWDEVAIFELLLSQSISVQAGLYLH